MKIVIPAAGKGTRLKELTQNIPKPLISVKGKPIISHIIDSIDNLDYSEIIIIIGYMGSQIKDYIKKTYPDKNIRFVWQESQLGFGHAIYQAKEFLNEPFIVILGDIIVNESFSKGWYEKYEKYPIAVGIYPVLDVSQYGVLINNKVIEKPNHDPTGNNLVTVGLYIINDYKQVLEMIGSKINNTLITEEIHINFVLNNIPGIKYFKVAGWWDCGNYGIVKKMINEL